MAAAIAASGDPVTMGARRGAVRARPARSCPPDVRVVEISTDDAWMRDIGPTFVVDGAGRAARRRLAPSTPGAGCAAACTSRGTATTWSARKIAELERADRYRAPLVLEGGSIHVDGEGTVLTTEECLLNPNRNPDLGRARRSRRTCATHLGRRAASSGSAAGVVDDETDGHVDNLACFVAPGVVALTWTDDRDDPQHAISADARARFGDDARAVPRGRTCCPSPGR